MGNGRLDKPYVDRPHERNEHEMLVELILDFLPWPGRSSRRDRGTEVLARLLSGRLHIPGTCDPVPDEIELEWEIGIKPSEKSGDGTAARR